MANMDAQNLSDASDPDSERVAQEAQELEELIGRLVEREASAEDVARLQSLSADQARRLKPYRPVPPPPAEWDDRKRA